MRKCIQHAVFRFWTWFHPGFSAALQDESNGVLSKEELFERVFLTGMHGNPNVSLSGQFDAFLVMSTIARKQAKVSVEAAFLSSQGRHANIIS
jgi:hypothetical protein